MQTVDFLIKSYNYNVLFVTVNRTIEASCSESLG